MKKNTKLLIVFLCLIVLCIGFSFLSQWLKRVPSIPNQTVGNTAGNLYNKGLFCESEGKVYFSNAYDNNKLYCMNTDETELKKMNDSVSNNINCGGDYIYYFQSKAADDGSNVGLGFVRKVSGLYRIRKDGKKNTGIARCVCDAVLLYGNALYYQYFDPEKGLSMRTMDLNGKAETILFEGILYPVNVQDDIIYFADVENDQILCTYQTQTGEFSEYLKYRVWNPVIADGYLYFMDVVDHYRLCRYHMSDGTVTALTNDRVDCFNVNDKYIVYQSCSSKEPALKRMELDGSNPEIIKEGNYTQIQMTSNAVYFNAFNESIPVYRIPAYGDIEVSEFTPAKLAAIEQLTSK